MIVPLSFVVGSTLLACGLIVILHSKGKGVTSIASTGQGTATVPQPMPADATHTSTGQGTGTVPQPMPADATRTAQNNHLPVFTQAGDAKSKLHTTAGCYGASIEDLLPVKLVPHISKDSWCKRCSKHMLLL